MSNQHTGPLTYAAAGVDIDAADETVRRYGELARRASRPEVLSDVGPFAGLFRLGDYRDPVLVSSADGVGTKLLIAKAMGRYGTVGQDLVNHCVNDILTAGAEPLFFLDYLATADLSQDHRVEIVEGVATACQQENVALVGGETADMADVYRSGDYDIAGFIVGVVERDEVIDGARLAAGDALIALPSNGLMTNGYSLVREAWGIGKGLGDEHDREVLDTHYEELATTLGEALLAIHPSFYRQLKPVLGRINGLAHITGGGIPGNLSRIFPEGLAADLDRTSWETPPLFDLIQRTGNVSDEEMSRAFNMGVAVVIAVAEENAEATLAEVEGAWRIGVVGERGPGEPAVRWLT
jgi:phosphoribosylformylglycinamidine cyclo-ligase